MEEIIFKTIWQSAELGQLGKGGQDTSGGGQDPSGGGQDPSGGGQDPSGGGQDTSGGGQDPSGGGQDLAGDRLELSWKERSWLLRKPEKNGCGKIIEEEQLSCPELRRSAASTNVSALNLSCGKESDSSESWHFEELPSPLAGTENRKALWSSRQPDSSTEKLRNLCQKTRELEDTMASVSELKLSRQLEPGNSQKRMLVQIAQSMRDLRQRLTSQLNEVKGIDSPATSTGAEGKVSLQMDNMGESPGKVSDSYQSKASLQHEEARTLSDFRGKFETLSLQWEHALREHDRTMQMLRDLKMEIDSIANNSKKMFSAFDQIQKNIHKLSHIRPLIQHIQKLLERRKNQWSTEPGYLSSVCRGPEQGEVLQQLVDQAVRPLLERMRRLHHTFDCRACAANSRQNMTVPWR